MNTDPSEIVVFLSDGLSRMQQSFVRVGFSDKGQEFFDDEMFETMMQEGMDFLCADSSLSVEARKSAWSFQINKITSYVDRALVAPQSNEILLQMMSNISDNNFIEHCTKRAELIERIIQKALKKEVSSNLQTTPVTQRRSM